MRLNKRSFISLSLLVLILLTATVVPAMAKPLNDEITYGPTNFWVSCANGGEGEWVTLEGPVNAKFAQIVDAKTGAVYNRTFFNRKNVPGYGWDTENTYVGSGPYESKINIETLEFAVRDYLVVDSNEVHATFTYDYFFGVTRIEETTCVLK